MNHENPDKMHIRRRDLLVGAAATTAASAIPEVATAHLTSENASGFPMEEWKPITLEGGQKVQVTGLEHSASSFVANFKGIHDRIKKSKLVILEGNGMVGKTTAEIASAMTQEKKFLERPDLLMRFLMEDGRATEFDVFYGGIAGTALLENKRVFEIESQYGISGELLSTIVSAAGTLHLLSKTSQKAPHQLFRNAAAIQVLSGIKERVEATFRAGRTSDFGRILEFNNEELLRFAWNLSDWRDLRTAAAIKRLPSKIPTYWGKGESARVFRGSDHGPALTQYLKSNIEPEVKRLTYPHWEVIAALDGSAPRDDIREITRSGVQNLK